MFELANLVDRYFGSRRAYSSYTMSFTLACHRLVQDWDSDTIAKDVAELEYVLLQCLRLLAAPRIGKQKPPERSRHRRAVPHIGRLRLRSKGDVGA